MPLRSCGKEERFWGGSRRGGGERGAGSALAPTQVASSPGMEGLLSRDVVTALRTQKLPMRGLDGIQGLGPCQWQMLPNRGCVLGAVGSNWEETLGWF